MTAQVPDTFLHERREYAIVGINGSGLFDPLEHGITPIGLSSANWRGFSCRYRIRRDVLHLDRLRVGADREHRSELPTLFGAEPTGDPRSHEVEYRFKDAPIAFSGGLLLGHDFVQEHYVHMGFAPGWKFRNVLEIILDGGKVVTLHDHTERIAELRERIAAGKAADPDADPDLLRWIARTFELSYGRTFG